MSRRRAEDYAFHNLPGPIAIAKKGGDAAGSEKMNTMPAFQSAYDLGATVLELDTVETEDLEALIYHDAKNRRHAKRLGLELTRVIQRKPLADVRSYLRTGDEEVPTLKEVLAAFPGIRVYVDIKTPGAAIAVARAVLDQRAQERVSLGSFNYGYTKIAASLLGGQERIATSPGTLESYLLRTSSQIFKRFVQKSQITSIHLADYQIPGWMIGLAKEEGINLNTWAGPDENQDNREYIERNLGSDVDGIMSIRTKDLVEVVGLRDQRFSVSQPIGGIAIEGATA